MESILISVTILLKLNIADLIGLLYLRQMIGVYELLKVISDRGITELSLKILLNKLKPHMTYSGFSWTEKGKTIYHIFCVVPFGLSVSGFTSKPVCSHFFAKVQFS